MASEDLLALDYQAHWLDPSRAERLLRELVAALTWEQREIVLFGKRILQPRLIAWAGELPYRYSGATLEPRPWLAPLDDLLHSVIDATGFPFNHALLNRYRDGQDSMGAHSDDEPELGKDPPVAIVSFGAAREMLITDRQRKRVPVRRLVLESGSLLVMRPKFQALYRHSIPKSRAAVGQRVSVTFRYVLWSPR